MARKAKINARSRPFSMTARSDEIRRFYDEVYHRHARTTYRVSRHLQRLARYFEPWQERKILDVACGQGEWLRAASALGAVPAGIDVSQVALNACRQYLPHAELYCAPAEQLPFAGQQFDLVSCLGAIEHFLDPQAALREIVRVAKQNALFLFLVPNSGFLYRSGRSVSLARFARALTCVDLSRSLVSMAVARRASVGFAVLAACLAVSDLSSL
ncbi:MAG: class I SAM-dependent methyltransferase [Deltaproteobacteria bacterium]|nr:MAG: class I SAM-dependent methyltransferase [Deltaproteobacteria bacterium]